MDLLLKRRQMMLQSNTPIVLPSNYVTDGLVLWLDGIDKGNTTNHWIDKIDSVAFIGGGTDYVNAPTPLSNCFEFDGSQFFYDSTYVSPTLSSGTLEIVFQTPSLPTGQAIYTPKSSNSTRLAFYINNSARIFLSGGKNTSGRTYSTSITTNTIVSVSASTSAGYVNGSSLTSAANSYVAGANSYNYIGKRRSLGDSSGNNFFTGKIYSIRLYSKQLSAAEVAANLAVDNVRFNMGLTLS